MQKSAIDQLLEEWKSSLYEDPPKSNHHHAIQLPVSQYSFDDKSAACACIALAFSHFALKSDDCVRLRPTFSDGVLSYHTSGICECIENGHRWWKSMQDSHSHLVQRYMSPFQVMGLTKDTNTGMHIAEHTGILGAVTALSAEFLTFSLVTLLRDMCKRAQSRDRGTAAVFTYRSSSTAMYFWGKRRPCKDAEEVCLFFDSHPAEGATVDIFEKVDDMTRWLMQRLGVYDIEAEFVHANCAVDETPAVSSSSDHVVVQHEAVNTKLDLTQKPTLLAYVQKFQAQVGERENTHSRQFELLELWL